MKTNQYNNKAYMYGPKETTLAITIPRITVVKTVEIREIYKRKSKDIVNLEQRLFFANIRCFSFYLRELLHSF